MLPATDIGSYPSQSVFFLLCLPGLLRGDTLLFFFCRLPTASASWGLAVPMCARSAGHKSHQKWQALCWRHVHPHSQKDSYSTWNVPPTASQSSIKLQSLQTSTTCTQELLYLNHSAAYFSVFFFCLGL